MLKHMGAHTQHWCQQLNSSLMQLEILNSVIYIYYR